MQEGRYENAIGRPFGQEYVSVKSYFPLEETEGEIERTGDPFHYLHYMPNTEVRFSDEDKRKDSYPVMKETIAEVGLFLRSLQRSCERMIQYGIENHSPSINPKIENFLIENKLNLPSLTVMSPDVSRNDSLLRELDLSKQLKRLETIKLNRDLQQAESMAYEGIANMLEFHENEVMVVFNLPKPIGQYWWKHEQGSIKWGNFYRSLMKTVWEAVGYFQLERNLVFTRLNQDAEHDPEKYYYLWKISLQKNS